jgi:hypothetical protein
MKREKNETRGIGDNKPPKPLATPAQIGEALSVEAESVSKSKDATANRYRLFLMLTTSDPELAQRMCVSYKQSLAPAGQTSETRERVRAAKNVLFRMFNAPVIPDAPAKGETVQSEEESVKKRRELIQRNALDSIRLCDAIHTGGYGTSFEFHKDGGTYIAYESMLGKHLWDVLKWNDNDTYKQRRAEKGEKDIQLVSSAWYTAPAKAIVWTDLVTAVAGAKREGQAPKAKREIVSTQNVSNGLQIVANHYESNPPKANELAAVRGTLENVRRIVNNTVKGIPTVSDKLAAFLAAADALINCFADPNKAKVDVVSPDAVNELPAKAK